MANTFNNASVNLSTTTITDVYQAPVSAGAVSIVLSTLIANVNGTASSNINLVVTDSSNTVLSQILYLVPVPQNTTLEAVTNKIVLKSGQKLRATASVANYISITLSCLEIT